jgi:hypothetical protein
MTPEEIEQLFQRGSEKVPALSSNEDDDTISDEEKQWRTDKLKDVLLVVQQDWLSGSDRIDRIVATLATGARDRK